MASPTQQETPADDLPRMPHVDPAVDLPPSIEQLNRFPWVDAQLQIPTGEFGVGWAEATFGAQWQETIPFLVAVVTKKIRRSKINGQRWVVVVKYDKSEIKRGAQYLYDRIEDREYLKDILQPKLPVATDAVAASSEDTAAPAVGGAPTSPPQPPQVIDTTAAATKVTDSSVQGSAKQKPARAKKCRRRPESSAKKVSGHKRAVVDSDSADTASESDSEADQSDPEPEPAYLDFNTNMPAVYVFDWVDEVPDPDAPRADIEQQTPTSKSNV